MDTRHPDRPRPEQPQRKLVPSDDEVMETRRVVEEIRKSSSTPRTPVEAAAAPTHDGSR